MSDLRAELAAGIGLPLRSPRDLETADLIAYGPESSLPELTLAEASHRQGLWNFRWTPLALHRLLHWTAPSLEAVPPPVCQAPGNLGALRARLVGACLGRLGRSRPILLAAATGPYVNRFLLVATHPGQPVQSLALEDGHPLERALGRLRRLPELPIPPGVEGLTPAERELLVRLEQYSSIVEGGRPHRLAAWAQDLARRLDLLYATTRLLERALSLAVFRAGGRGLEAAAYLLGVNDEGELLCL